MEATFCYMFFCATFASLTSSAVKALSGRDNIDSYAIQTGEHTP